MRIPGDLRKAVVYVGSETGGRFSPLGTGTLVCVKYKDYWFDLVVVAKHVVDQIWGDSFSIRLNRLSGLAESIRFPKSDLIVHEHEANDVAIFGVSLGADVYDIRPLLLDRAALEAKRATAYDVALGDEVVAVGLYTSHYGLTKNIPVTRIGNLAMLLEEPVRGATGYVDAYLVELRTIAGLSGSPVFINPPPVIVKEGQFKYRTGDMYLPLGILVGYHVVESKEDQVPVPQFSDDKMEANEKTGIEQTNTGFGIVIPIERILEIVERQDLVEQMEKAIATDARMCGFKPA